MSLDRTTAEKPIEKSPVDEAKALRFKHTHETEKHKHVGYGVHEKHPVSGKKSALQFPLEQPDKRHGGVEVQK